MASSTPIADERGVAPVIGVVLLIGITVILASTVAAFALGLGDEATNGQVPTLAVEFDYSSGSADELAIEHKSGEVVSNDDLYVQISGASCTSSSSDPDGSYDAADLSSDAEFATGKPISVTASDIDSAGGPSCSGIDLRSATVTLSWRTSTGSSTIRSWDGPG